MAYRQMWEIEVRHEGLNKYRHIRGSDRNVAEQKAHAQRLAWDEMWEKKGRRKRKNSASSSKEEKKESAITKTNEAQESIKQLETLLQHTLTVDNAIDWDSLLNNKPFPQGNLPTRSSTKYPPSPISLMRNISPILVSSTIYFLNQKQKKKQRQNKDL